MAVNKKVVFISISIALAISIAILAIIGVVHHKHIPVPTPPQPVPPVVTPIPYPEFDNVSNAYLTELVSTKQSKYSINITLQSNRTYANDARIKNHTEYKLLEVYIESLDDHLLHLTIRPSGIPRWELPDISKNENSLKGSWINFFQHYQLSAAGLDAQLIPNKTFYMALTEKDGTVAFNTTNGELRFFDQYIAFQMFLSSPIMYGLGERFTPDFMLNSGIYTLFNREQYAVEDGKFPGKNTFSSHAFIMNLMPNGKYTAFLMRNSNAMDVNISLLTNSVTYKMTGGIVDLYIIHQADSDTILKKYHNLIEKPYLPPFWGLGLQLGRRFNNTADIDAFLNIYNDYPVDAVWMTAELMDSYKDFTINQTFNNIQAYSDSLATKNIHLLQALMAGIKAEQGYPLFDNGKNFAIMNNKMTSFEIGKTIAGNTMYLDFNNTNAVQLWNSSLGSYLLLSHIYGFSIDLDEISTLSNGTILDSVDPTNYTTNMSYYPGNTSLNINTISMDAKHLSLTTEYNAHNLYGLMQIKATSEYLSDTQKKRTVLLSRSTFPGSGKYGGHFLGNVDGSWNSIKHSINNVINFNMFGIPYTAPYIGGFNGITDDELCTRWVQLGAFLPLFRFFHNGQNEMPTIGPLCLAMSKGVLTQRYSLMRFLYTKMFESSIWGGSVIDPLIFRFPEMAKYNGMNYTDEFLIGNTILQFSPQVHLNVTSVSAVLPNWRWFYNNNIKQEYVANGAPTINSMGLMTNAVDFFVKGGSIIPYQDLSNSKIKSSADLVNVPLTLLVYPDHTDAASGTMVVDDGLMLQNIDSNAYRHYDFVYSHHILKINLLKGFDYTQVYPYEAFRSINIFDPSIKQGMQGYACLYDTTMNIRNLTINIDSVAMKITITDSSAQLLTFNQIESIVWIAPGEQMVCNPNNLYIKSPSFDPTNKIATATLIEPLAFSNNTLSYSFQAKVIDDYITNIRITRGQQYNIPNATNATYISTATTYNTLNNYSVEIPPDGSQFYIKINDGPSSSNYFFTTKNLQLTYGNHFIMIRAKIRGTKIFGIGERIHSFELQEGIYTLMSRDIPSPVENGKIPGNNMYGEQPFYLISTEDPNLFAAVMLLNASPMDFRFRKIGTTILFDHIMTGGDINFFFIQKGTPNQIIQAYHRLIGKPVLVPLWSHGFHQCRYGWKNLDDLKNVYSNFTYYKIPLDVLWTDIDYMYNYENFIIKGDFLGIQSFVSDTLHANNVKFVPIIDAGLARTTSYAYYNTALSKNLLIKSSDGINPLVGVVWPGYAVYVDFFNPQSNSFWASALQDFSSAVAFDGVWLDMNEPSNFCDGECSDETHYIQYTISTNDFDNLIYIPSHRNLDEHMPATGAKFYGGLNNIDVYGTYGHMEDIATDLYFSNNGKRPFIISRSNFIGSGKHASHWLGDNFAEWDFLRYSVSGIYNYQMFGIPLTGADICGFMRDSSEELCERWMQLGSFYPFSRNHNDINSKSQEPYVYKDLIDVSKAALAIRYSLIRYYYTLYMSVAYYGGTYFRPLLFDYPNDTQTYYKTEDTFLIGSLKVSPVMDQGASSVTTYFPNDDWYDLFSGLSVLAFDKTATSGKNISFNASIQAKNIPVHVRGGSVVVMQDTNAHQVQNTKDLEGIGNVILVAVGQKYNATGYAYYDDGVDPNVFQNNKYVLYSYTFYTFNKTLVIFTTGNGFSSQVNTKTESVRVYHNNLLKLPKCAVGTTLTNTKVVLPLTSADQNVILFNVNDDIKKYQNIKFSDLPEECSPKLEAN